MAHINRADIYVTANINARDLVHPGTEIHEQAAKEIYKLL